MASSPAISVYMPAFNVARFIRSSVQSILDQTFTDFEFIIIDDGSTDETPSILREFASRDRRIRLLQCPHQSVAAAANEAIRHCRAPLVARTDGDDIALPQRLEKQHRFMQEHPECVALGSLVLLIDEQDVPLFTMPDTQLGHDAIDAGLLQGGWPISQTACMYRRNALEATGGYNAKLNMHEDHELFLRLAELGRLENLPEVLQHYRQHPSSTSFRSAWQSQTIMPQLLAEARQRRGLPAREWKYVGVPRRPVERMRWWAWMSLKSGNVRGARKYARQSLQHAPLSTDSWRLMYCALRGY